MGEKKMQKYKSFLRIKKLENKKFLGGENFLPPKL